MDGGAIDSDVTEREDSGEGRRWWRRLGLAALIAAGLGLLYYPLGAALIHVIDDDLNFTAEPPPGGSAAVARAAALIERETRTHRWTANDPIFVPSHILDNMPHFQQGIVFALSRFAVEMADQIGRTRGSSQVDADLEKAAGMLKFPGTVWLFDFSTSWTPTTPSEKQYQAAQRALLAYNERLASGQAVLERRADNLMATLERISKDLGSASAVIDQQVAEGGGVLFDTRSDDVFYATKGRLYAYALLLEAMKQDFAPVIRERELANAWDQMLASLRQAAAMDPLIVVNGDPDSLMLPSHLAVQGFYLLRTRVQIGEIINILLK